MFIPNLVKNLHFQREWKCIMKKSSTMPFQPCFFYFLTSQHARVTITRVRPALITPLKTQDSHIFHYNLVEALLLREMHSAPTPTTPTTTPTPTTPTTPPTPTTSTTPPTSTTPASICRRHPGTSDVHVVGRGVAVVPRGDHQGQRLAVDLFHFSLPPRCHCLGWLTQHLQHCHMSPVIHSTYSSVMCHLSYKAPTALSHVTCHTQHIQQ